MQEGRSTKTRQNVGLIKCAVYSSNVSRIELFKRKLLSSTDGAAQIHLNLAFTNNVLSLYNINSYWGP